MYASSDQQKMEFNTMATDMENVVVKRVNIAGWFVSFRDKRNGASPNNLMEE